MSSHNSDLQEVLKSPTRGVEETVGLGGVLARLWRTIILDLRLEYARLEYQLNLYIEKARKDTTDPAAASYYNKGNLRRELAKKQMTFKVFMKALRVLDITHIRFAVELTHRSGRKTAHQVEVDISAKELMEDLEEDTKEKRDALDRI